MNLAQRIASNSMLGIRASQSELINFKPSNTLKMRKAIARARTGGARVKVLCPGDSTTRGSGSGPSTLTTNIAAKSYPATLSTILASVMGLPASQSVCGMGIQGVTLPTSDPRVAMTGGWGDSGIPALAKSLISTTGAGTFSFTPTIPVKSYDVYWVQGGGAGGINIDGGSSTAISGAFTGAINKTTVAAASSGTHTLNVTWTSGTVYLPLVIGYDTTALVDVINCGWHGSVIADWQGNSNPWETLQAIPTIAPDLSIICLTINDAMNATATGTFSTQTQTLINACLTTGDVILMIGAPTSVGVTSAAAQAIYSNLYYNLAATNDLPLIDLRRRLVSYEVSNPLGLYFDTVHPNGIGYADIAQSVANAIGRL